MSAFPPVRTDVGFPAIEVEVQALWRELRAFERSVEQRPTHSRYVFYDGPPFATGLPHYGHLVASTLKDIVPRYWTMRGHRVERRFGWDTHGLPIEMEMEKTLGLSGPRSIRDYGVDRFNEACRENVLRYTHEWERVIGRLGRWVDFANDYKTMDPSFMESVWWVFKQLWDKDLVYRDLRVMPFSTRLSTSLSNFEANLDYRDVDDPAITVTLPLDDDPDDAVLLVWTTTPWTLPSNLGVAAGEDVEYVRAKRAGDDTVYILASAQAKAVLGEDCEVLATFSGRELVGRTYVPLFDYFIELKQEPRGEGGAFFVMPGDHVTADDGTGLVHMAPAYGEEDFTACRAEGMTVVDPVDEEGRFTEPVRDYVGQHVKDADPHIMRRLKEEGRLFHRSTIRHSYPFCWRSGTPLIYKTVPSWFVRAEWLRERMIANNEQIHWVPDAVGTKRFGNWLAEARDWNVSRNRFWGTPIPVWTCESCGEHTCVGSIEALERLGGETVTDLHPHKIDHLTIECGVCGGPSKRIAAVFDCWFESGAMPYAQDHYPFENAAQWEANFPAQFIAEGLDQTRGWFYTLLVLSTALFDKPSFSNCVVNGMVLAEDGSKMSKQKRNYPDPMHVLETYGADALRAALINSPVVRAEPFRFSEAGVREVVRTVLLPLRSAWSFFVQYANIDGWHPRDGFDGIETAAVADRPEQDRWILSVLQSLVGEVNEQMEGYYLYRVVPPMVGFIDHLTNWYIRRSRRRFWRSASDEAARIDKAAAYETLYEVLVTFSKVMAPVLPFITEALYQNLVVAPGVQTEGGDSIHLCDYPEVETHKIDRALEDEVRITREVVSMGRALREKHKLKTRQPLSQVTVVHHGQAVHDALERHAALIEDELNVKRLVLVEDDAELCDLSFKANFKTLGRRLGKRMKEAAREIQSLDRSGFATLQGGSTLRIADADIGLEDVLVQRSPRGDVVLATQGELTVAIETALTPALVREGLTREVVSRLQRLRKDRGFDVTDRVRVILSTDDAPLREALDEHRAHVAHEVLADALDVVGAADASSEAAAVDIEGHALIIGIDRV